ncbi:maltokinase N-terminal cap-like domain-containing protein [Streptomyces sp. I05A-00742]|uniref:maltokinase N-terminal cap-like domain-containing protein n=1 Tax=Streptomyces sp. I05A-00742 TaxID=2732853 RepID=UPI001488A75A|nr:maltokinase [Streptomyces sp. I05A-00742]
MSDAVPPRRETTPRAVSPGSAPSGVAAAPPPPTGGGPADVLLASLAPLLTRWLPRQRWFAGKGSPVTGLAPVTAVDVLPVTRGGGTPGLLHLLVRARQSGTGADDCYQLLLGVQDVLPPQLAPALIGRPTEGPLRGLAVYEALADPRTAGLLLERLRVPGRLGPLRFVREADADLPAGLAPRLLGAEQSNSSVVYGDSYILKLFRRVGPGVNPDLELPRALARAGCTRVPAPAAWCEAEPPGGGEPMTLGVLQPFLPGSADGWQLALGALAVQADFTGSAHALGHATAEVHRALAGALPTLDLHPPHLERIAAAMHRRLDAAAEAVPALRGYRAALRATYDDLTRPGALGRSRRAQRIHGDLHLGQALRTAADGRWSLIDFEGEPARPLAERRRPQPVEQDVAGMLRSFDYAAAVGRAAGTGWADRAREAFCDGYAEAHHDPREDDRLLRAHETDKAVYEVLYEARHRPDWLSVPLTAIRRLAAQADGARRRP